jgi:hypothetical protein
MPGNIDAAWPKMTTSYQNNQTGGRRSYERFWAGINRVTVKNATGLPPDRAEATVTYSFKDGRTAKERTSYRLVRDDGVLKINSSTVISSKVR